MTTARTPRLVSLASLFLASGAFALSTWTACQEHTPTAVDDVSSPAVQGERADALRGASGAEEVSADAQEVGRDAPRPAAEPSKSATKTAARPKAAASTSQEKTAAEDSTTSATPPQVKRLVLATDVENREPLALDGAAQLGEPLVAFVEAVHPGAAPATVVVTFEHSSGQKVGFVELEVPGESPRYRTWARTRNIKKPGEWQAVVRLEDGSELARQSFTVAGSPAQPTDPVKAPSAKPAAEPPAQPAS